MAGVYPTAVRESSYIYKLLSGYVNKTFIVANVYTSTRFVIFFLGVRSFGAKVQSHAPDFKSMAVVNNDFKEIGLADYQGKYLVLFFYPLDL